MTDFARVEGWIFEDYGLASEPDAARVPARTMLRFTPVVLDERAAVVLDRTITAVTDTTGRIVRDGGPVELWAGRWKITLPDGETIGPVDLEAGRTYDLVGLRGFVPAPGQIVQAVGVVGVPADGQALAWSDAAGALVPADLLKGDPGDPGRTPTVEIVGDQLAVDGVVSGPHLTGPKADPTSLSIGTVATGAPGSKAAAAITGEAPAQTLSLTIPQGPKGDDGRPGPANVLSVGTVTTGAPGSAAAASVTGTPPAQTLSLTIPQGLQGPAGPAGVSSVSASSVELRGTGSPLGQVTPPSAGVYYTDTAGTCGAWRWIATGTTSSSWVVSHGDTGRRDVSSLVSGLSAGKVYMRRIGSAVTYDADDAQFGGLAAGVQPVLPTPAGFTPSPTYVGAMFAFSPTLGMQRIDKIGSGLRFSDADSRLRLRDTRTWQTTDAWPTTLPGSAA